MDGLDLQRLLTSLIMPLPLGLGFAIIGLILLWRARRVGWLLIGSGVGVIALASSPLIAEALMASLEQAYPPQAAAQCRPADAIVLLGGAVQPWVEGDARPRLQRSSDRVWEASGLVVKEYLGYWARGLTSSSDATKMVASHDELVPCPP